jgi:hypothetical protein
MMLRKSVNAAAVMLLLAFTALAQAPQPMKGYELYSWKVKGHWHYAVLAGTNRAKTYEEIISKESELVGTVALHDALKKLPRDETIFWMSTTYAGVATPQAPGSPVIELPSRQRIKRLRAYCEHLGIKLMLN